jgi:hypothetical protein
MKKIITPSQRRTIEVAQCLYCDRKFYLESNEEITPHMEIPLETPFQTGFVYQSANGFNIITSKGGILSDIEFGEQYTHDYMHQVATCKNPLEKEIMFEKSLKTRTVKDLKKRLEVGNICVPILEDLEEFRNRYRDYLAHRGYENNKDVYETLIPVESKTLN